LAEFDEGPLTSGLFVLRRSAAGVRPASRRLLSPFAVYAWRQGRGFPKIDLSKQQNVFEFFVVAFLVSHCSATECKNHLE
jgi:hypothetical protein